MAALIHDLRCRADTGSRPSTHARCSLAKTGAVLALVLAACSPVEGGPPDLAAVESHLRLGIGYVPEGCDPVGLDGDGRGGMMGAAFECPEGTTLRLERFDSASIDGVLPTSPSEAGAGHVEWRDEATGDVIRVASDVLDNELLLRVGGSIEVRD